MEVITRNSNNNGTILRTVVKLKNAPKEHIKGAENMIGYAQGVSNSKAAPATPNICDVASNMPVSHICL